MSKPPRQNNGAEFDAFCSVCERLGGFDHRTTPEWADGYLTAMATGARAVPMQTWMPRLAGDAFERAFADPDDRAAAERALHARVAVLHDQLDADALFGATDRLRLSPLMLPWTDDDRAQAIADGSSDDEARALVTGAEWADGFFAAIEHFKSEWPPALADDDDDFVAALLAQVHALVLSEGSDELRAHVDETYGADAVPDRDRLVDEACFAVQDLRLWVVDNAARPPTRHVEKTPGRNDPCPCGSGKKYKKCHGA